MAVKNINNYDAPAKKPTLRAQQIKIALLWRAWPGQNAKAFYESACINRIQVIFPSVISLSRFFVIFCEHFFCRCIPINRV
jgi:hypothetical protein